MVAEVTDDMSDPTPALTVARALAEFETRFSDLVDAGLRSSASLEMHRLHVGYLVQHFGGDQPLALINTAALEAWAACEGAGRRGRRVSNGTLRKRAATLRLAMTLAHRRGHLERVPPFPELEHRYTPRRRHLRSPAELVRLLEALPLERAEWVVVAVFSGMHPSDVDRLSAYDECDPFSRPPWWIIRNTKNRRDPLRAVMPAPAAEFLREIFKRRRLEPGDPVVRPWPKDLRCRHLRDVGERLGFGPLRASDLRRTCGTWAVHQLRSITKGIQDYLGHGSSDMCSRVYAHALPPALGEVAAALSRMVRGRRLPPLSSSPRVVRGKRKTPVGATNADEGGNRAGGTNPGGSERADCTIRRSGNA